MRVGWLGLALALAACGHKADPQTRLDNLDAQLTDNATGGNASGGVMGDPALTASLHDQIMVDPQLVQQANRAAVRPAPQPPSAALPPVLIGAAAGPIEHEQLRSAPPASGACPQCAAARQALTLGALAEKTGQPGTCAATVAYSAAWANRLPPAIGLYPDARVTEAAGANGPGCALRVVSFASPTALPRLLDWYYTHATAGGYAAQHHADGAEHVLAGTRAAGGAFMVTLRPRQGGGTDVDLMADGG